MLNVEELKAYIEKRKNRKSDGVCNGFFMMGYKDACSDILDKIDELQEKNYTIIEMKCDMETDSDYEAQCALG
jgi:hypothetical protein